MFFLIIQNFPVSFLHFQLGSLVAGNFSVNIKKNAYLRLTKNMFDVTSIVLTGGDTLDLTLFSSLVWQRNSICTVLQGVPIDIVSV